MEKTFILLKTYICKRNFIFFVLTLVALTICYEPLKNLLHLDINDEYYSHIIFIPLISGYLIYKKKETLFAHPEYSYTPGAILLTVGVILYLLGRNMSEGFGINDYAALITFSALILWTGGFIFLYGVNAFRAAVFPFFFLLFMIPVPGLLIDKIIYTLQVGSTWVTYILFKLAGIPFMKEGFTFHCPGVDIEVAKQCSGIRSTMGLLIPTILAGYLFLNTGWRRALLIFAVFPITVLKNGLRILVLSALAIYVNPQYPLLIFLHNRGGVFFYLPAMFFLGFILLFLRKSEQKTQK